MDKEKSIIQKWAGKVNWNERVKAVCKPCWELKYCPYGILVEEFPFKEEFDDKSCRIFGHDCPVYYTASPMTETKELRRITRYIPRPTQFRVLKRENQICQMCSRAVKDEEIEFDHIIPWSKGGSSDESNIRLLCSACNRKRSNNFENDYLVKDFVELVTEPNDIFIINFLLEAATFGHQFHFIESRYPLAQDFADCLTDGEVSIAEIKGAEHFKDLIDFFTSKKPTELRTDVFEALKFRWGFEDGQLHKLNETTKVKKVEFDELFLAERNLVTKMGIRVKDTTSVLSKWKNK